ncbi:MAG: hypothetical protein K2J82_00100 [Muribaculaceae bacterium]|nr:hypothetical protein [Muribaculaceae bacterium]
MAYSCLLLKKHNPTDNLIFYGNEDIVRILGDLFQLPYDNYKIIEANDDFSNWFYCWPKILTYEDQQNPFIHVDIDIFMWKTLPSSLRNAPLIAQHLEYDSTFYLKVYDQMKKDNICFPDFMKVCCENNIIKSYNAGLLGGYDLAFFDEYIHEIRNFLEINKSKIALSERKFLYNVVFEQWLFYGLSAKYNKSVSTFYNKPIRNFDMEDAHVPLQILNLKKLTYLHVMEYKRNWACNRFIVYKMRSEFPDVYDRILSICKQKGIESSLYYDFSANNDILFNFKSIKEYYCNSGSFSDIEKLENEKNDVEDFNIINTYKGRRSELIKLQDEHNISIEKIRVSKYPNQPFRLALSPLLKVSGISDFLLRKLLNKKAAESVSDWILLKLYNPIFNTIDRFMWTKDKYQLLLSLLKEENINEILTSKTTLSVSLQKIKEFIAQCIFDGIIVIRL